MTHDKHSYVANVTDHEYKLFHSIISSTRWAPFFDVVQDTIFLIPPLFSLSLRGVGDPLTVNDIAYREKVWVEPVDPESDLSAELRGWYRIRGRRLVENEFGNRFYLDTYGAKWLAFATCLPETDSDDL